MWANEKMSYGCVEDWRRSVRPRRRTTVLTFLRSARRRLANDPCSGRPHMCAAWADILPCVALLKRGLCCRAVSVTFAGLPWVWEFPWVWVWDGYGDYDETPWVCGDSMGIFEWIPNYVETS